jgi:hypothetical protein
MTASSEQGAFEPAKRRRVVLRSWPNWSARSFCWRPKGVPSKSSRRSVRLARPPTGAASTSSRACRSRVSSVARPDPGGSRCDPPTERVASTTDGPVHLRWAGLFCVFFFAIERKIAEDPFANRPGGGTRYRRNPALGAVEGRFSPFEPQLFENCSIFAQSAIVLRVSDV